MALPRIRQNDSVKVMVGKDKGRIASVQSVSKDKVYLSGIGERKRHAAANQVAPAGKRDIQVPIHISNVALIVDEKSQKTSRVGMLIKPNGEKVRVAKALKNKEIKSPSPSERRKK